MDSSGTRDMRVELRRVYDTYRTALLNRKYYAHQLTTYRTWNLALELAIALGTSSTIGAWAIWKQDVGQYAWAILAAIAAVIAVVKPILQLPKGIERYSKLYIGYTELYFQVEQLVDEAKSRKRFTEEMSASLRRAFERVTKLGLDDDPKPRKRLLESLYQDVQKEIPAAMLWMPGHSGTDRRYRP